MASRRAFLVFLFIATVFNRGDSLRCRLYHRIWEDGKILRITPDICHTSSKYCVYAVYSDPDETKKNGFSMGCDRVDCQGIANPLYTGWYEKNNGMTCKKHRDYGKHGEICCCASDMCNSTNNTVANLILTFIVMYLVEIIRY